jgi:hypothetical protein
MHRVLRIRSTNLVRGKRIKVEPVPAEMKQAVTRVKATAKKIACVADVRRTECEVMQARQLQISHHHHHSLH